ncbi:MAG: hypothetical protein LBM60_05145 [Clostridium sp.]|jgi:hypothetical protein|nr:hypothetical protein [Clostridium sp.]
MYVAVLFNRLPVSDLYNWYIHMGECCVQHNFPLITTDYYPQQDFDKRFNPIFHKEMSDLHHFNADSLLPLELYTVPVKFFDDLEIKEGSYTKMQVRLSSERCEALEEYLERFLLQALSKRPSEKLDAIFSFGDTFESLRYIGSKFDCPVIAIELSAIRTLSGNYVMSLYYAQMNGRLFGNQEYRLRYEKFIERGEQDTLPLLSRRELIALFCKKEALLLIPLLETDPAYEIAGFALSVVRTTPPLLLRGPVTDDDLQKLIRNTFSPEESIWRERPFFAGPVVDLFQQADPLPTILSSKRTAAVASNALVEAMLWNRTACAPWDIMPFSFACENNLMSDKKVDIVFLNFLLFGCLIPGYNNIFNPEYWSWRMTGPSEKDIYEKHLGICLASIGITSDILSLPEEERFLAIMRARGCDDNFIAQATQRVDRDEIPYHSLLSYIRIQVLGEEPIVQYCRNSCNKEIITSKFSVSMAETGGELCFRPILGSGFVHLESLSIEGAEILECHYGATPGEFYRYCPEIRIRVGACRSSGVLATFTWRFQSLDYDRMMELLHNHEALIDTITLYDNLQDNLSLAMKERDMLQAQLLEAIRQRDALQGNLSEAIRQRDTLQGNLSEAIRQRDALQGNLSEAIRQRDAISKEHRDVLSELEAAINTIISYERTIPYKLSKHFKKFAKFISRKPKVSRSEENHPD